MALTIFLIAAPVAVFCVYVARKLIDDFSDHLGITIMAIAVIFTIYVRLFLSLSYTYKHTLSVKLNKGERRKAQLGEEKRSLRKNLSCWSFFL